MNATRLEQIARDLPDWQVEASQGRNFEDRSENERTAYEGRQRWVLDLRAQPKKREDQKTGYLVFLAGVAAFRRFLSWEALRRFFNIHEQPIHFIDKARELFGIFCASCTFLQSGPTRGRSQHLFRKTPKSRCEHYAQIDPKRTRFC